MIYHFIISQGEQFWKNKAVNGLPPKKKKTKNKPKIKRMWVRGPTMA
jgi:hypothetical protein